MQDDRPDDLTTAIMWRDNVTSYAEILEEIESLVAKDITEQVEEEKKSIAAKVNLWIVQSNSWLPGPGGRNKMVQTKWQKDVLM